MEQLDWWHAWKTNLADLERMGRMNIDLALIGIEDDELVPQSPSNAGSGRLDDFFENSDYGLQESENAFTKRSATDDSEVILMHLPRGKVARVYKRKMQACKTSAELRELDRSLYREAGLDLSQFGL
jgi:hypothetical protein